ncbi:MarR family transcriptional regulator [Acinetobacter qingfengensis]|uniref:MarR family transcriptional regulator n=1 Tax=Acinetobacter qingfengensis TaxID=1262585 RepID=A0A1E7QWL0_9GAMM|nr:MarR family transcriptional regulator [Acinetobacter qingfengensis]KAA8731256.1 MarR family transcriptional regulator [Acinetobacter qingfengensis]OEY91498.1 MarR family transcriptional regulator [Acinetobacter qingfengensis]
MTEHTNIAKSGTTLSYAIARTDRLINKILNDELKKLNISLSQFTMLSVIQRKPGLSNAKLAELSFIKPQSATKVIQELENHQWITKRSDPEHGRRILIELSALGLEKVQACREIVRHVESQMLGSIDSNLAMVIKNNLDIMSNHLKHYTTQNHE